MIGSESEDSANVRSKQDTIKNAEVHFQQLAEADSLRVEQARGQLDPQLAHRKSAAAGGKEAQSLKGRSWNQNRSHLVHVAAGRRGVRRSLLFRSPNTLFNRSYGSQLERFLEMLVRADHRLFGKNERHRIQIVDCRESVVEGELELGKEIWIEEIYARLSAILLQKDPWNLRLQELEEYVRDTGKLPRQEDTDATARSLGSWLRDQGIQFRKGRLQPQQVQNLMASPSSLIRERAKKWVSRGYGSVFLNRCQELGGFILTQKRLPIKSRKQAGTEEYKLASWLRGMRGVERSNSRNYYWNVLRGLHPLVCKLLDQWEIAPHKIQPRRWERQFGQLQTFVLQHQRLPAPVAETEGEIRAYRWLRLQRIRLTKGGLPGDFHSRLCNLQPLIAQTLSLK